MTEEELQKFRDISIACRNGKVNPPAIPAVYYFPELFEKYEAALAELGEYKAGIIEMGKGI